MSEVWTGCPNLVYATIVFLDALHSSSYDLDKEFLLIEEGGGRLSFMACAKRIFLNLCPNILFLYQFSLVFSLLCNMNL